MVLGNQFPGGTTIWKIVLLSRKPKESNVRMKNGKELNIGDYLCSLDVEMGF